MGNPLAGDISDLHILKLSWQQHPDLSSEQVAVNPDQSVADLPGNEGRF